MRPVPVLLVFATLLLLGTEALAAGLHQAVAEAETVLSAVPVSEAPRLDGVLDEPLWKDAPRFDKFLQQVPDEGKPATERTQVRIVYTRDKLYFGVTVFYSEPHKMIANELRYDSPGSHVRAQDDTFSIMLDTFHDHRNGYLFTHQRARHPQRMGLHRGRTPLESILGPSVGRGDPSGAGRLVGGGGDSVQEPSL